MVELSSLVEEPQLSVRPKIKFNHIGKIPKTGRELRMNAQIGDYDMDFIILDLGSNINIMTRKTLESMGKTTLVWSPIQLCLSNQSKVLPIG